MKVSDLSVKLSFLSVNISRHTLNISKLTEALGGLRDRATRRLEEHRDDRLDGTAEPRTRRSAKGGQFRKGAQIGPRRRVGFAGGPPRQRGSSGAGGAARRYTVVVPHEPAAVVVPAAHVRAAVAVADVVKMSV